MQHWIDKLTDLAAIAGDENTFKRALAALTKHAGFDRYAYLCIHPGHLIAVSNYPAEWRSLYFEQKYVTIDPVVKRAKTLKHAFQWNGDQERPRLSKAERKVFSEAADFGIRSGLTIPVKGANGTVSMLTLASGKTDPCVERDIDLVAAAAAVGQLHMRMAVLSVTPDGQDPAWLDPKESAYLKWISVGKTMEEAADLEGVKYNSVKSKLEEARKRLKIHTMPHLVALAIRAGLI